MSIRSNVNVVNSALYPPTFRRFIAEGKDDTSAGILTSGNHAWISKDDKLFIVDTDKGWSRPIYSFGEDSKNPVDITCIEELVLDCTTSTPLLLVGTSSMYNSQLCVFNPAHSRVIRAIQLDNLQVRCMAVVEDGRSSINSLTDVLSAMEGVVALGCADGSVVLVDLNRQTIIKAYQGNLLYRSSESTPLPLKFVSMVDEDATIMEIGEAQRTGASSAITLIEGDGKDVEFGVTALTFSRETACLYIGYSSGLWQIWNLSFPNATMMYECAESTSPVSSFCQIEPCEDPRPTVYLWVNHEGTESSLPLLNMYTLSYANKHHVNDYGVYYQDFISCSLSFSMYPGEEFPNVTSGRLVSARAYSKTIRRHLIQNMGLPEMEGIQMKLVATIFSLTNTRGSTHTYLCIFDLDQWYKEQMPHEPNGNSPYLETSELCSEPLLASTILIDSISLYHTEEPQEIHLVPQAFSFKVIGLSENGLMTLEKVGVQKLWLANTELIGAKSLIHPTKLFHACVSAGLVPMFPAHQNPETSLPTNEEMRSYIMSVCLDNGLIKVILEVGEEWESGVHATSNCTLNFLFDWVWSSVSTAYKSVNGICETLFSASGQELDVSLKRRLQLSRLILDRLYYIHTAFCSKYNHSLYADILEPRLKAIDIIISFVHLLSWFVNVGLLPEANSQDLPPSAIRYDYLKLDRIALDRRQRLNSLYAKFKRAGKVHDMPGAGLYLVDHFVHDYNELGQQWEDEGGSTAYPPPSIQSLLRSLRIPTVPTATKLALVQYTLLDLMSIIDKSKHEELVSKVNTIHLLPKINATQNKVINGLWHLDHCHFEEGLRYLLDRTVTVSDLSEGLHRAILRLLLFEGKEKLAIQYLRFKNPPLSLPDDLKLEMSVLLANKLTSEAYHFQREHTYLRDTLLRQLFTECLANGEVGKLLSFHLDESELNFFHNFLAKNRSQRNDDLRVLLLISRSKYVEAKVLHEKLLASSADRDQLKASTRDMIVNGLASTLCPMSHEMYLQKINPNLKNLPEFKSSKPRPLSVYIKTIDDGGFPNFGVSSEKLCASALACSANLWRFVGHKYGKSQFNDILGEEPMICSEENPSLWSKQDIEERAPGKRSGTWVSGANKRQRMDEDATQNNDIATFLGTPLVMRRSKELTDPADPNTTANRPPVHSILKSGKTPGTPGRSVMVVQDELETPKKTLRWDIPSSELRGGKDAVKKSLLSTSLLTPTKDEPLFKSSGSAPEAVPTSSETDSIKTRLRSHSPLSAAKKDSAIWAEIAEEAKAKVLFSYNLPAKKEKKSLTSKPVGPSFVVQVNQLIEEERLRKENDEYQKGESFNTVEDERIEGENANLDDEDVEMQENTPPSRAKPLRFLDLTMDSNDRGQLELSGSPYTKTAIPKELRAQLRSKLRSPQGRVEGGTAAEERERESLGDQEVEDLGTPKKMTPVTSTMKRHSKVLFADSPSTKSKKDDDFTVHELPSEESPQKIDQIAESSTLTVGELPGSVLNVQAVELSVGTSVMSSFVEQSDVKASLDTANDDESPKIVESSVASDETKNAASADKSVKGITAPTTPQITNVVSLSRSHYTEDEDEVGSEDPEEAEIPPIIEFSQPEEGLVIDASYSLKESSERPEGSEDNPEEQENEAEDMGIAAEDKSDNDSGSSVICLDSDSDEEPKDQTQLDYKDYEEDSYSLDSEEADHSSRGRRSFFHDKYNTHQEESEESPSPEYSSEEDEKRDSDVDLYNMDDMEDNDDRILKDDELDDEIFAMGRGIQESKDLDVSSDEDDDLGEEEGMNEEEEIDDEEEDYENPESALVIPAGSEPPGSDRRQPDVDEDVQELSSGEEDAAAVEVDLKQQSSQDSDSESSSSDEANPTTTENDSSKEENGESTFSPQVTQDIHDEDQSAVVALLGLAEPPNNQLDFIKKCNREVESLNEPQVRESPKKSEQIVVSESTPSKATDVIDCLNLSPGQMFFGSPEVQICDKPPDRALFQFRPSTFTPKCSESDEKTDQKVEEVSTSEETLVLRLEESDIVHAKSPEAALPSDIEVIQVPDHVVDSSSELNASNSCAREPAIPDQREVLVDEPNQELIVEPPSNGEAALSEGALHCELGSKEAKTPLKSLPDSSDNVVEPERLSPSDGRPVQSVEPVIVEEVIETVLSPAQDPAHAPVEDVQESGISSEHDGSLKPHLIQTDTTEMDDVVVSTVSTDCVSKTASKCPSPSHQVPSSIKNQAQRASFSCQAERIEVEVPNPHPPKETVGCQTTLIKSSPSHSGSKSFSCQASMDTTKYGFTVSAADRVPPTTASQDSVTSTCLEDVDPPQVASAPGKPPLPTAEGLDDGDISAVTEPVPVIHMSSSTKETETEPCSEELADTSVAQVILEPPTPFKTLKKRSTEAERDLKVSVGTECSSLGVEKLDDDISAGQTADEENPCDMAFVDDTSITAMTGTPKTPVRKSLRLARMSTPGRALARDDEVNVSYSMLDIAVLDPEVDEEKPVLVDRSMITEKRGLDKTVVSGQIQDPLDKEAKPARRSRKSSHEKIHREPKKDLKESEEPGTSTKTQVVEPTRTRSPGVGSVGPEVMAMVGKILTPSKKRVSSVQRSEAGKQIEKPKSRRASSHEPEVSERHKKLQKDTDGSVKRRRSSSVQPETRDDVVESEKRRGRRSVSVEQEVPRKETKKSSSRKSSGSESSRDQGRRHSSVEPEAKVKQREMRRASSEGPSSDGHHGSRKRRSSTSSRSRNNSPSPPKTRRLEEPLEVSGDKEYRKRKIKHSITEPLEKKKHQLEEQTSSERKSNLTEENLSSGSGGTKRKSRSLLEYPVRRSVRPSVLASITELPEDSPQPTHSTKSMRASTDNLTALESLMSNTKHVDISKWMALSGSQVARARRLSGRTSAPPRQSKKDEIEHLDLGAFMKTLATPVKDGATSPTGSIASISSTASSKVLRSGRVIDENTPTKRPREHSARQAARSLKLVAESPVKVQRSGRHSAVDDGEEDDEMEVGSSNTSLSSAHSAAETTGHLHDSSIEEVMSSRRLTRHQRSILESSMASTSRGRLSPVEESASPVPKRKPKKH